VDDIILNTIGITVKMGFLFCKHRIQDSKESFVDVPVAHIAKYVPSSCSWIVGARTTFFLSQKGILIFETSVKKKNHIFLLKTLLEYLNNI